MEANSWVEWLTIWVERSEALAGPLIFAIAFAESFALVGVLLPGVALLFAIGVLTGSGLLPVIPSLLWCFAGAVCGDGVSFLLGRYFKGRLKDWRLFRRHPDWLLRSRYFFRRHGMASIVVGRFIGPLRPIVPLVAGSLAMAPARFFTINVLTALIWAPAYLLPGFLVGASATSEPTTSQPMLILMAETAALCWLWWMAWRRWPKFLHRTLATVSLLAAIVVSGLVFHHFVPPEAIRELGEVILQRLQG